MSLHRNIKTRYHVFEEEFANSILNAMELTEQNPNNNFGRFISKFFMLKEKFF